MTLFQDVYDAFFIKANDDFLYKQDQVFQFLKTAIAYSYKTISTNLDYKLYSDNSVLIINNIANTDGDIQLNINDKSYTIAILTTDTLINISEKIKSAIQLDWDIEVDISNSFPIIIITKTSVDNITTTFNDIDTTGIEMIISRTFDGEFINTLGQDDIELLSLYMKKEYLRQKISPYISLKQHLGTKDFNRLPEKSSEYKTLSQSIKDLDEEIKSFRQEFNTYKN